MIKKNLSNEIKIKSRWGAKMEGEVWHGKDMRLTH